MAEETSRKIGPVVLLGPPGAGKGTQSQLIARRYRIPHVSTGDILRENVQNQTVLGRQAKANMARGELVSDTLVCDMVADRLRQPDSLRGFILDGFPRTAAQAGWLDAFLEQEFFDKSDSHKRYPIVICIRVDYNKLSLRLTGRRTCPACDRIYNVYLKPPLADEICDVDGSKLVIRDDDRTEVIQERLAAYERQTTPVVEYYQQKGRLVSVDGDQPTPEVTKQIFQEIDSYAADVAGGR
ncbi:MAG: adenylate kinase [Acidobacteriales bacterium]|nr:adenylate kinase [Terriglobales bacterium]